MNYTDSLPNIRATHPALASRIEKFVTLEHILNWLTADGYPLQSLDMITQDEYCHDLLFPLSGGSEWLVFGMT